MADKRTNRDHAQALSHGFGAQFAILKSRSFNRSLRRAQVAYNLAMETKNPTFLNDLSARVKELIEHSPAMDLDKNLRAMLTSTFAKMDLVTREEFDIQKAVLARTREKIAALEARVASLEAAVKDHRG
jgi:ubiquinone biosynthesis accessory factor UbiK